MYKLLAAAAIDFVIGDPHNFPHPVRFIGKIIYFYEKKIREIFTNNLKIGGLFLWLLSILTTVFITSTVIDILHIFHPLVAYIFEIYIIYTCIAARCLHKEAYRIKKYLQENDIITARKQLSYIVGRDTENLSSSSISKAVIETVAENTIDGVIAPLFFIIIGIYFKIPAQMGILYKTVNTLDSIVGYNQEPYKDIGYFSAKIDDIFNFIPARLGSIIMLISGIILDKDIKNGFRIFKRDRYNHKSPNSGHSESVIAGLLNIQLGGTNYYFGKKVEKPYIGDNSRDVTFKDINNTVHIMYISEIIILIISYLVLI